jgi:hypothetical protein
MALSWAEILQCDTARLLPGKGKVKQVKELARRAAIKKRKLTEAVEKLVDEGGHHLVDAEGMAGLELRPVNDGMIDEVLEAGLVADVSVGEND